MKMRKWILSVLTLLAAALIVCPGADVRAASGSVRVSAEQDYAFAQKILKEVNKRRTKKGLKKLKMTEELTADAMTRAMEIMVYQPTGKHHRRPNGKQVESLNAKIDRESTQVYAGAHTDDPSTAEEVVDAWISQTGILKKSYRTVGIGVAYCGENEYFVLLFSKSSDGKTESSKEVQTVTKTIRAKTKYLSKKFFELGANTGGFADEDGLACYVNFQGKYTASEAVSLPLTQFTWSSSSKSVASVSKKGVVKFKKNGTVTITAKQKASPKVKLTLKLKGEKLGDGYWKISKVQ